MDKGTACAKHFNILPLSCPLSKYILMLCLHTEKIPGVYCYIGNTFKWKKISSSMGKYIFSLERITEMGVTQRNLKDIMS